MGESGSGWHVGTCTDCGSAVDHVYSVGELELCLVCLESREETGDPAAVEVFADAA
jgi:hypothetical protein